LKPQSFTLQATQGRRSNSRGNNLEVRIEELQNTLVLFVATTVKTTPTSSNSKLDSNRFEYGAIGELVVVVATRSQTNAVLVALVVEENIAIQGGLHVRHQGPPDSIGQSRLPLTFGLANVVSGPLLGAISNRGDSPKEKDIVKDLALKLL